MDTLQDFGLTFEAVRVLGALIEKEITTPEYYPLTLNSLTLACNQKSNRDPILALDEKEVVRALDSLRDQRFAVMVTLAGSRVPKYRQIWAEVERLEKPVVAVMCELMVRGPQTTGELRNRCERLHLFPDVPAVEGVIAALMNRGDGVPPLVARLPRRPGQKECRYAQLLSGPPAADLEPVGVALEPATREVRNEEDRIATLSASVETLRGELAELKQRFLDLKRQFE